MDGLGVVGRRTNNGYSEYCDDELCNSLSVWNFQGRRLGREHSDARLS